MSWSVAPRAGAWIETETTRQTWLRLSVAPRAGAWIETISIKIPKVRLPSRPARARGLKLVEPDYNLLEIGRAPRGRVD